MCGIVWVHGIVDYSAKKAFRRMLDLDTVRGSDSTGIIAYNEANELTTVKAVGTPWDLRLTDEYNKWAKATEEKGAPRTTLLVGHNRFATKGKVTKTNAHPFTCGNITGVHNGTLINQDLLVDSADFDVDSHNIFHHMNKKDELDALVNLDGAFTLAWVNQGDKTFNLTRNDERPMHIAVSLDGKTVFGASEAWMLEVALAHAKIKHQEIFSLETLSHLKFDLQKVYTIKDKDVPEPKITKYEEYQPPFRGYFGFKPRRYDKGTGITTKESLIGKEIVIEVVALETDPKNGHEYVTADYIGDSIYDPRFTCVFYSSNKKKNAFSLNKKQQKDLLASVNFWYAKVVAIIQFDGEQVLLLNANTLEEQVFNLLNEDSEEGKELIDEMAYVYGYGGDLVTVAEFNHSVRHGCACCSANIFAADDEDIWWVDHESVLCPACSKSIDNDLLSDNW